MRHLERSDQVHGHVLFDDVEAAQVVVDGDAGVVDEDIERLDLRDRGLNLRRVRHVQSHGGHAFIDMVQRAASAGVDSARSSCERLVDKRPPNAPVGSGDQDCLLFEVHGLLPLVSSSVGACVRHEIDLAPGAGHGGSDNCGGISMDSLITAAAHALAAGDPLGALKRIALRDDAPALALRGIAMAQLGDLARAKVLLRRAERGFHPKEVVARARCVVAEAEIAFVSRDLGRPTKALEKARLVLEAHGDRVNAAHARSLEARRLLLIGRLDEAERQMADLDPTPLPPVLRTVHELVVAGIAIRRLRTKSARAALSRAAQGARHAGIPGLTAEVERASLILTTPAARLVANGEERLLLLEEVEALPATNAVVVDACRHAVRRGW